jgi:hypothetical protein
VVVKGLSISGYSTKGSVARFSIGQTKGKPVGIVGLVPKPGQSLFGRAGHVRIWSGKLVKWAGHPRVVKMDASTLA